MTKGKFAMVEKLPSAQDLSPATVDNLLMDRFVEIQSLEYKNGVKHAYGIMPETGSKEHLRHDDILEYYGYSSSPDEKEQTEASPEAEREFRWEDIPEGTPRSPEKSRRWLGGRDIYNRARDRMRMTHANLLAGNGNLRRNTIIGAVAGAVVGLAIWKITGDHASTSHVAHGALGPDNTLAAHNGQSLSETLRHNGYQHPGSVIADLQDSGALEHGKQTGHELARNLTGDINHPGHLEIEHAERGLNNRVYISESFQTVLAENAGRTTETLSVSAADPLIAAAIGGVAGGGAANIATRIRQNNGDEKAAVLAETMEQPASSPEENIPYTQTHDTERKVSIPYNARDEINDSLAVIEEHHRRIMALLEASTTDEDDDDEDDTDPSNK
jgi:hypothetical protein